jgi:hypothetical protein
MNQSLVGLLVINAEVGREDYCLIPATTIKRGLEPHDIRTDLRTTITSGERKKSYGPKAQNQMAFIQIQNKTSRVIAYYI